MEEQKLLEQNDMEQRSPEEIYASYGISQELLQGMQEYRNALFRGMALTVMILSFAMIVVCAVLMGVISQVTLLAELAFSIEAMLLLLEKNSGRMVKLFARGFFMVPFLMVLIVFGVVRHAPESLAMQIILAFFGSLLLATAIFGTVWYFSYYPYQSKVQAWKEARAEVKDAQQIALSDARLRKYKTTREKKKSIRQRKRAIARLKKQERREIFQREKEQLYEFARRQSLKAEGLKTYLPGKREQAPSADDGFRLLEGARETGKRGAMTKEEASLQASKIMEELQRETKAAVNGSSDLNKK